MTPRVVSGADGRPPARAKGMLGPTTSDEFPVFGGYHPPVRRSEIETFTREDANFVLDGDGTPGGHGYHRHGLGIKDAEFPEGWEEHDLIDLVYAIVDAPVDGLPGSILEKFSLFGGYRGVDAVVQFREEFGLGWRVSATYPIQQVVWFRDRSRLGE